MRQTPGWFRVVIILSIPFAVFGMYLRFAGLQDVFCRSPDELAEITPGLRLHTLPFWNIQDTVRANFFQSLFYSNHGLGDVSFYYLASGVLSLLGLPVSERFLFLAGGVTNVALAIAGGVLCKRLLDSAATGWVFASLVLVSPYFVFVSKSGWGRLTWTPLLLVLLFLCQWRAMRSRGAVWPMVFCLLAGFVSLTDGFVMFPLLGVLGLLIARGRLRERVRLLATDRVFLAGCAAFAAGVAVDVLIGLGARRRGTQLTMVAYVMLRGGQGSLVPSGDVLAAWTAAVDMYFPFRGAWIPVVFAFALAAVDRVGARMARFVAAWWLLASAGVIRYAQGQQARGVAPDLGWLNAYNLAVPSLLLVAWLIVSLAEGRLPIVWPACPTLRRAVAVAVLLPVMWLMARQAHAVVFAHAPVYGLSVDRLLTTAPPGLDACRVVKAAASYVRSHDTDVPYVFHLSSDVYLGHIGEFYYGLSYGRSVRPEEANHLLDFGPNQFGGRQYPPHAFYRPYGVDHFDYYVDFIGTQDPFTVRVIDRLLREGAHVVCTIRDGDRVIGRILSFRNEPPLDLDYRIAAQSWDRTFARARTLLQQPIAGTAYHFGYNWKSPE